MTLLDGLDNYQAAAKRTAIFPPETALSYLALGLASEAGEVAGKVKKILRDDAGTVSDERAMDLLYEIGDVLWYVAILTDHLDFDLSYVATKNIEKLSSRAFRGVLGGRGTAGDAARRCDVRRLRGSGPGAGCGVGRAGRRRLVRRERQGSGDAARAALAEGVQRG